MTWGSLTTAGKLVLLGALLLSALVALAQDGQPTLKTGVGPKLLEPTELQSLRLQVKQKDALLARNLLEQAQGNFQKALDALKDEGDRVKAENGWKDAQFDPSTLQFAVPAAPPAVPAAPPAKKEGKP